MILIVQVFLRWEKQGKWIYRIWELKFIIMDDFIEEISNCGQGRNLSDL
jgi:hypothetical protein